MDRLLDRLGLHFPDPAEEREFFAGYGTRNLVFIRLMLFVGGGLFVGFIAWDRAIDPVGARETMWLRLLLLAPAVWIAALLLYLDWGKRRVEPVMAFAACVSTACVAVICARLRGGIDVAGGGIDLVVLFVFSLLPMRVPWYLLFCATTLASYFAAQSFALPYRPGMSIINGIMISTALFLGGVSVVSRERAARRQFVTSRKLDASRARVEELLHSMLPSDIVRRIQSGETQIADLHGEVSIVFSDLVGFTELSRRISAPDLVQVLNRLFSAFDRAADRHGMHKIKTIGDAYMAVGGLVANRAPELAARDAAEFALAMHREAATLTREMGVPLSVRVGLHVGPVVAGVIGTSRPAFDCWGEAVNLASRLESSAKSGDVLLSERASELLQGRYQVEAMHEVQLKGIGAARVYRLAA